MSNVQRAFKSIRGNSVRSHIPLTNEEIMQVAPSIFTAEAAPDRSDRYQPVPTIQIVDALRTEGFEPFMVAQTRTRDDDRMGFARHMLRLRHRSQSDEGIANEVILTNSHDGTGSYQMYAGLFREVCANGCVWGDETSSVRVAHRGRDIVGTIIDGAYNVVQEFERMDAERDEMGGIILADRERAAFGKAALLLKYDDPDDLPVSPLEIIRPRRYEDNKTDLWSTRTFGSIKRSGR
jgi:hypothetical protein